MSKHPEARVRAAHRLLAAVLVVLPLAAPAGRAAAETDDAWVLGPKRFVTGGPAAEPLKAKSEGEKSLRLLRFVGRVGGVNFEEVARPAPALKGLPVALDYVAGEPDGRRLAVLVDGKAYFPFLPDWQLKPIALFADSGLTATVSLFGQGPERDRYYYIRFHPAFRDTLLGMRLLQGLIGLTNLGRLWDLPRWQGRRVMGLGEPLPDEETAMEVARELQTVLAGASFRSWVLTDTGTAPEIRITAEGRLEVTAAPYFYFWTVDESETPAYRGYIEEHNRLVRKRKQAAVEYNRTVMRRRENIRIYNGLIESYNRDLATMSEDERREMESEIEALRNEIEALEGQIAEREPAVARLDRRIAELRKRVDDRPAEPVPALTDALRKRDAMLRRYNPAVYDAYRRTAAFAALFRYVRKTSPDDWARFVETVRAIRISPAVVTPTAWER